LIDLMRHGQKVPIGLTKRAGKSQYLIITCVAVLGLGIGSLPSVALASLDKITPPDTIESADKNRLPTDQAPQNAAEKTPQSTEYLLQNSQSPTLKLVLNKLEKWQAGMGQYVDSSGERLDRFFGDDEFDVTRKGSRLDLLLPTTFYDNGKTTTGLNFRAQIDLPRTNHRWKIVLTSFEDSLYDDQSGQTTPNNPNTASTAISGEEDQTTSLGARYMLFTKKNSFSHLDFGLKFTDLIDPNPFGRFRTRFKSELSNKLSSRTTNDVYLERARGGALDTEQVFDYQLQSKQLLRSQTSGVWWHERGDYLLNQKGIWYKTINPHRVRAYYISGNWQIDNENANFTDVSVGMNWREKLYKEWLFGEIEPKAIWREDDNFQTPDLSLMLKLEMRFYPPK
jgi:hypothetical protein